MIWIKIANSFPSHPKIVHAGPEAAWLFVCSICYANEHLTDGHIPVGALPLLPSGLKRPQRSANRLVDAGLWEVTDVGWRIHDYLDHQRSSEQILIGRQADRERKRRPESGRTPSGVGLDSSRGRAPAPTRQNENKNTENPPVVPPKGGRQRDRQRWENDIDAYAAEHFPQLPRSERVRVVRQAFRYGHAETPQDVTAFIREHFPDLAGNLEASP